MHWPQGSSSSNLQPDVGKGNDLHTLAKCKVYILYVNSDGKESACNAGDLGSIPGLERSPGGGHGSPLQYSCLENPHGQRSLAGYSPWATVCKELDMTVTKHTHTSLVLLYFFLLLSESPTFSSLFRFCFYFYIIGKHKSY